MSNPLHPKTHEKMIALTKKIAVAHNLDQEIQTELQGHLEDKLLAYLNGEETVSEEDALILAEKHFGDAATLKALLQDVYAPEVQLGLTRRLLAIFIASCLLGLCLEHIGRGIYFVSENWLSLSQSQISLIGPMLSVIKFLVSVLVLWFIVRKWRRSIAAGRKLWFQRWSPLLMMGIALCVSFIIPAPGQVKMGFSLGVFFPPALPTVSPFLSFWSIPYMFAISVAAWVIWYWWCDESPRRPRHLIHATGLMILLELFPAIVFDTRQILTLSGVPERSSWTLSDYVGDICLTLGAQVLILLLMAGAAYLAYEKGTNFCRRLQSRGGGSPMNEYR